MSDDLLGEEILGADDLLGDDLLGDELLGEEILGDELLGDDVLGDELIGDQLVAGDDLLGDDLVAGDDLLGDDVLGAWRRRQRKKKQALGRLVKVARAANAAKARKNLVRRAIMAKKLGSAKVVEPARYTHARVQSMGLSRAGIQGGETVDIIARPQEVFKPRRLIIPSSIASNFMIEDVKVGRTSQFVSSGRQPAVAFTELATADNFNLKTCKPGMDIVLKVTNISQDEIDFDSTIIGDVVE
jgi:hypothetical protein